MPKSYDVMGYALDADLWCPDAIKAAIEEGIYTVENPHDLDANGIPYQVIGREGNEIGAVFADAEFDYVPTCGHCHEPLIEEDEPLTDEDEPQPHYHIVMTGRASEPFARFEDSADADAFTADPDNVFNRGRMETIKCSRNCTIS